MTERRSILGGSAFEEQIGYARAVIDGRPPCNCPVNGPCTGLHGPFPLRETGEPLLYVLRLR